MGWGRSAWLLVAAALVAAAMAGCSGGGGDSLLGGLPDTGGQVGGGSDASPPRPDAGPSTPDAAPPTPDAAPPTPDAAAPDAAEPPPECEGDEACPAGQRCADMLCVDGCRAGTCPEGERCDEGLCVFDGCRDDEACPADAFCTADGACEAGCRLSPDNCPGGQICNQSRVCVADDRCDGGEICGNGIDDDCDGEADEPADCGMECVAGMGCRTDLPGPCAAGTTACLDGPIGPPACRPLVEPRAELCNQQDDDCDGQSDEVFQGVGEPCVLGEGVCLAVGVRACAPGGQGTTCRTEGAAEPGEELCNTFDDDCDGSTDEGFEAIGTPCTVGDGRCETQGAWMCNRTGRRAVCDATPGLPSGEICDGEDNDCDARTDEGFAGLGEPCEAGEGLCRRAGVVECRPRNDGVRCSAVPGPAIPETCNGQDDDCDGIVDESRQGDPLVRACYSGPAGSAGVGECRAGFQACDAGEWGACAGEVLPRAEVCDGRDQDCDGNTDEALGGRALTEACYSGPAGTAGRGACAGGVRTCRFGHFGACDGEVLPEAESCNSRDEDCNGLVDDVGGAGCACEAATSRECYSGPAGTRDVGVCRGGSQICAPDGRSWGVCIGERRPGAETCNGLDDDCDGQTDEDIPGIGVACRVGRGACAAEGVSVCDPLLRDLRCDAIPNPPRAETCNAADDDCDGRADETFALGQVCRVGQGVCAADGTTVCGEDGRATCSAVPAAAGREACNGADDDCDGRTDEDFQLGDACNAGVGACQRAGRVVCGAGGASECSARPGAAAPESCNGADDDCDGRSDEGFDLGAACSVGAGMCQRDGQRACDGRGGVVCQIPGGGNGGGEICNGADDDCDQRVDEGNPGGGEQCDTGGRGVCGVGRTSCVLGRARCLNIVDASAEACDGLDNDCDGNTDEDFGGGQACVAGEGACARAGMLGCDAAGNVVCSAVEGAGGDEVCNGRDDDCDGRPDEGLPGVGEDCAVGIGICRREGTNVCRLEGLVCNTTPGAPEREACDGEDDDCDGRSDEGFQVGQECSAGIGVCRRAGSIVCTADGGSRCDAVPGAPAQEQCDQDDDDCDGRVDEGACPDVGPPTVTIVLNPPIAEVGQGVTVRVDAVDDIGVVARTLTIDGQAVNLNPATGAAVWVPQRFGAFVARGTASDAAGNTGEGSATLRVRDPNDDEFPFVRITGPADATPLVGETTILGTVTDENFMSYRLEMSLDGGRSWTLVNEGFSEVENEPVGTIDARTLPTGIATVRLTGEDLNGREFFHMNFYPVDGRQSVGEQKMTVRDLYVPVRGLPLAIDRKYDSRDRSVGDFGHGWRLGLADVQLHEDVNGNVVVRTPDGAPQVFTVAYEFNPILPWGIVSYRPSPQTTGTLEALDVCVAMRVQGQIYCYGERGGPAITTNRYRFTTVEGTVYELHQDRSPTSLVSVTFPSGDGLTIDADGVRSTVGGEILFTRDAEGRITEATDPAGNRIRYEYDHAGDLVRVVDQTGGVSRYEYDGEHRLLRVVGADGNPVLRTEYDADGRKSREVDALGNAITYVHDLENRRETVTDRRGNVTVYQYDPSGRVTSRRDAAGRTVSYEYDARGHLTRETQADGTALVYANDDKGRQTAVTDTLGGITRLEYNPLSQPTLVTDPRGNAIAYTYDAQGRETSIRNSAGGTVTYVYDADGNRATQADALGNTYAFAYDDAGRVAEIAGPDGFARVFEHDALGNITSIADGGGPPLRLAYDAVGRLVRYTGPDGGVIALQRDPMGRLAGVTDPVGATTRYTYEARGLPEQVTDARGNVTRYAYDATGNLVTRTDAAGRVTRYAYDALDRLVSITDPLGGETRIAYDAMGRPTQRTGPDGARLTYTYDAAGQLTGETHPDGTQYGYEYDAAGRLTRATGPDGVSVVTHDGDDRVTRVEAPRNVVMTYAYDVNGRRTTRGLPDGETRYAWDGLGRLTGVTDAGGAQVSLQRDARGNVTRLTLPNGVTTTYTYDVAGRPTSFEARNAADQVLASQRITVDADGKPVLVERGDGTALELTYDMLGQLVGSVLTAADGSVLRERAYAYDAVGNRVRMVDGGRIVEYAYDAAHRLTRDDRYDYTYDGRGNLATRRDRASGARETFTYDGENRLVGWSRFAAGAQMPERTARYLLDARGQRAAKTIDGRTTRYLNDLSHLALVTDDAGQIQARYVHGDQADQVFSVTRGGVTYAYVTDPLGNVVGLVGPDGRFAKQYEYDDFGAIVTTRGDLPDDLAFGARPFDAESGLYEFRARAYDPRTGRFLQVDPEKGSRLLPLSQAPYLYGRNSPYFLRDPDGRAALISYAFLSSRFVVGNASADAPNYYEMIGSLIGFFHGFGSTALVFIANILDIAGSGGDVASQWGEAISRTEEKMKQIEGALGKIGAVDHHGFAGGFLNGGKFRVGIKISVKPPKPVGLAMQLAGVKPPSEDFSIKKDYGGFKNGKNNALDYIRQLAPR